jgi:peptide/nickel transport system permease protein
MIAYLVKRFCYAIPIIIGVNLITFFLFFKVNTPDDLARMQLGNKFVTQASINQWKEVHGYDLPYFYNDAEVSWQRWTHTLFVVKTWRLFVFDFGRSLQGHSITKQIKQRMGPSLAIAVPTLLLGLMVHISLALLLAYCHNTIIDRYGCGFAVILMSISALFFIIIGQYLFAKVFLWFPISGYAPGIYAFKFVLLPVFIGVFSGLGSGARWYRVIFLQELDKDYVLIARAKGLSELRVWFTHILHNGMVPIVTGVVAILPLLFMGSLLMESFFAIPGLGSYTIDAIHQQDFEIVRAMVFLGTVLYIVGLLATDIVYTWVDPRIRLDGLL